MKLEPDWNSWFPNAFATKNPTLLWQNGVTGLAVRLLQREPVGELGDPVRCRTLRRRATGRTRPTHRRPSLLNQWKVTLDPKKQQAIATQLEKIFLTNMPIVPLFVGPRWSTYSTKYFHCFNSPKNFYGDPIFSTYPDNLLSFTRICPGGKAGA